VLYIKQYVTVLVKKEKCKKEPNINSLAGIVNTRVLSNIHFLFLNIS